MSRLHDRFCKSAKYLLRRSTYMRNHPGCEICDRTGITMPSEELDHIIPLAERPDLAIVESNWQALCRSCHEEKTATESNQAIPVGSDGWPTKEVRNVRAPKDPPSAADFLSESQGNPKLDLIL